MKYRMICDSCGVSLPSNSQLYTCPRCQSRLRIEYEDPTIDFSNKDSMLGIFRFLSKLPLEGKSCISMGEGITPAILLEEDLFENLEVWIKNESLNPTGTYKDRPAAVAVSKAKEMGAKGVVVASDGNAAPAVAAYAAKACLSCVVLMPQKTPEFRCLQAKAYGAIIFLVDGTINDCLNIARELSTLTHFHNCSTTSSVNPYQIEGNKSIAFEIAEQFKALPDWVVLPVGGGGLLSAVVKGFEELQNGRLISKTPRILATQAKNCAPFVEAFMENRAIQKLEKPQKSVALTIALPYPPDGDLALKYLKKTSGVAVSVEEKEIIKGVFHLSSKYGILAEPSGAVPFAGLLKAFSKKIIRSGEKCLVLMTGTGLKTINTYKESPGNIVKVSKNAYEIIEHL